MSVLSELVQSVIDMPGEFADVALQGPVEAILVLSGAILVGLPLLLFTYLLVGAAVELVLPESFGASYP
ncbi:MAG: hypothetical protein ACOCY1_00110 [Halovenus sp.]